MSEQNEMMQHRIDGSYYQECWYKACDLTFGHEEHWKNLFQLRVSILRYADEKGTIQES